MSCSAKNHYAVISGKCHYLQCNSAVCCYAKSHYTIILLSDSLQNVILVSVVLLGAVLPNMPNIIMLVYTAECHSLYIILLSVFLHSESAYILSAEFHPSECHSAECYVAKGFAVILLSVILYHVILLNVIKQKHSVEYSSKYIFPWCCSVNCHSVKCSFVECCSATFKDFRKL
jgi:hypothetical protein